MSVATASLAEEFDRGLGDPGDPAAVFSYARCAGLDAAEEFPGEICDLLNAWGLQRYYVPESLGGRLRDFPAPLELIRAVARRDLTVAIAHGKTFLGGVSAWISPVSAVTQAVGDQVIDGAPVSWGLTERSHGSDLLAGEVRAEEIPGGYRLTGEKWLINNATRGRTITVLAHTGGGPRGFDVFVVDKTALAPTEFSCLPKVRTHGIRGADISGIAFTGAFVPASARLGAPGTGLETVLKGLQLTRTLCSALSLGAGEHSLRLALEFAEGRQLYGGGLLELPNAVRTLADAGADHLLNEAVALVGTRCIHALTGEMSLVSAVVKYLLPSRTDRMISTLGRFLGARSQLTNVDIDGRFQKLARDHRIVGIFDGNTLVNLNSIINEFQIVARHAATPYDAAELRATLDPGESLPDFDAVRLRLVSRAGSSLLRALPDLARQAEHTPAGEHAARVLDHYTELLAELACHRPVRITVPRRSFVLAERLSLCWAAAAVLGLSAHTSRPDPLLADGLWQRAVLGRILEGLGEAVPRPAGQDDAIVDGLRARLQQGLSLSLLPHRVAEGTSR
ncbi:acyl-CoA dehydrogenase family protein [Streptomyces sp. NPDC016566]|uniref:acyl-CoA dehydrogenase family protein n=1 Tax=Streptomyces sp. NPDC016566 TaxID=3364967 RepID=UPI0036FB5B69